MTKNIIRYANSLAPSLKLGDWTYDEDRFLVAAVQQYGKGNMAHAYLTLFFLRKIKLSKNSCDRSIIIEIAPVVFLVWTKIAPQMPGRTDNMALQRYKRLLGWKEQADLSAELPVGYLRYYCACVCLCVCVRARVCMCRY